MKKLELLIMAFATFALLVLPHSRAATISACTFDKNVYYPDDSGVITVTVFNDKSEEIRVTELTAKVDYFYDDGARYVQTFVTNETLPVEILPGNIYTLHVPFKLPDDIAAGYIIVEVNARTEIWNPITERWVSSDTAIYRPTLYVESPYKRLYEQERIINQQLQEQIDNLQEQVGNLEAANNNLTTMLYVLGASVAVLALIVIFLAVMRKPKPTPSLA